MKSICAPILLCLVVCVKSFSTPQQPDIVRYGVNDFAIAQHPMLGFWHFGEGSLPEGKVRPPQFQLQSTSNWSGYVAKWEISRRRLFLLSVRGTVDGKDLKNSELLPGKRFPVFATWFTGRIQLPIGDFDEETDTFESVIVFDIQDGHVKSIGFLPSAKPNYSWNGL